MPSRKRKPATVLPIKQPRPRSEFLGGSDIAAMIGVSPYKTRRQLWLEKTNQILEQDIGLQPHIRRGKRLEQIAADYFLEKCGGRFVPAPPRDPNVPEWLAGEVDRFWDPGDGVLAIVDLKVPGVDTWATMVRNVTVNVAYQCQVWHYMIQYPAIRTGWLGFYQPDVDEMLPTPVLRDEEFFKLLREQEEEFWSHVRAGTEPPDVAFEPPPLRLPVATAKLEIPNDELRMQVENASRALLDARALEKDATQQVKEMRDYLAAMLKTPEGAVMVGRLEAADVMLLVRAGQTRRLNRKLLEAAAPLDRDRVLRFLHSIGEMKLASHPAWRTLALDLSSVMKTTDSITIETRRPKGELVSSKEEGDDDGEA